MRGTYFVFLRNTYFTPGTHSLVAAMKGPEPLGSITGFEGSVSASRFGMIGSTLATGLLKASSMRPNGSVSTISNVFASTTRYSFSTLVMSWPVPSRTAQRLIEATQSSAVTGAPSWKARPSRSVKRQVSLSGESV